MPRCRLLDETRQWTPTDSAELIGCSSLVFGTASLADISRIHEQCWSSFYSRVAHLGLPPPTLLLPHPLQNCRSLHCIACFDAGRDCDVSPIIGDGLCSAAWPLCGAAGRHRDPQPCVAHCIHCGGRLRFHVCGGARSHPSLTGEGPHTHTHTRTHAWTHTNTHAHAPPSHWKSTYSCIRKMCTC